MTVGGLRAIRAGSGSGVVCDSHYLFKPCPSQLPCRPHRSPDEAPHAYAAIQKALALKDRHATATERAFIDAMAARYVEKFDPGKRVDQDNAYAEAMGRVADAERAYREELEDHPHNGWSLIGLQKALAGRGVTSAEVDADLAKSWARADTWIRTSRF